MSYTTGIGSLQKPESPGTSAEAQPVTQVSSSASAADSSKVANLSVEHNDQTSFTPMADLISRSGEGSDIRTAKISSLQQAISEGSYKVSSFDVADKVVTSLLE